MATRARTGNLIDRFRDRLTIPLRDPDGDLVGFTARRAPDSRRPRGHRSTSTPPPPPCSANTRSCTGSPNTPSSSPPARFRWCVKDRWTPSRSTRPPRRPASATGSVSPPSAPRSPTITPNGCSPQPVTGRSAWRSTVTRPGRPRPRRAWRKLTEHRPVDVRVVVLPDGTDPAALAATQPGALLAADHAGAAGRDGGRRSAARRDRPRRERRP